MSETALQPVSDAAQGINIRSSWNFSLDAIRQGISRYETEAKDLLVAAFRWCIDPRHPVSKTDFARRVQYSENLLYRIFTGNYRHPETKEQYQPPADLLKNIREFLKLEQDRFLGGEITFVPTPTAKKIFTYCELARESKTVVVIYGPSHIGKSMAFEHHTSANNHGRTVYVRMRAASGLGGMVRAIAAALGISDKSNTAALIERIINAGSPDLLFIFDEVHLLANTYRKGSFFACMEVIRELHDMIKCGFVLGFTILDDLKAASQKELQQIWRRGVHRVPLPVMPTKADLKAILAHAGLDFPDRDYKVTVEEITEEPYEILRQVAKNEALLAITERIRLGRKLASKAEQKLTWKHFVQAHLTISKHAEQEGEWK